MVRVPTKLFVSKQEEVIDHKRTTAKTITSTKRRHAFLINIKKSRSS